MMRWIGSCRPSHVGKLHDKDVRPRDFASQQAQHLAQAMLVKLLHRLALTGDGNRRSLRFDGSRPGTP